MYQEGSAAKKEYFARDTKIHSEKEFVQHQAKRRNSAARVSSKMLKRRILAGVFASFIMVAVILCRYAIIARDFNKLTAARKELEEVNACVVETQIKADGNVDPKKIERDAEKLGMRQPTKEQIKYISLGNSDSGEALKTEKTSALRAFANRVMVILEYLD